MKPLEFKPNVTPVMKKYIEFLQSHHGYNNDKLRRVFYEYINNRSQQSKRTQITELAIRFHFFQSACGYETPPCE